MNRVTLVGRLTQKPELRYTGSNLPFVRFSVAVSRTYTNQQGQRETDFINVVAWRKQAENISNFLDKGSLVSVEGRLQTGSYDDKDGNKKYTVEVLADSVQFLESKAQSQSRAQNAPKDEMSPYDYQSSNNNVDLQNDPFADFGDSVSIDDNFLD
jgi:single-strand DNA-binding protein